MNLENFIDIFKEFLFSEKNLSQNSINNYLIDLKQFLIFFDKTPKVPMAATFFLLKDNI